MLVQLRDAQDPESGEGYTVKRYPSEQATNEDEIWRHARILLRPINPDFDAIELTPESDGEVMVVAEGNALISSTSPVELSTRIEFTGVRSLLSFSGW